MYQNHTKRGIVYHNHGPKTRNVVFLKWWTFGRIGCADNATTGSNATFHGPKYPNGKRLSLHLLQSPSIFSPSSLQFTPIYSNLPPFPSNFPPFHSSFTLLFLRFSGSSELLFGRCLGSKWSKSWSKCRSMRAKCQTSPIMEMEVCLLPPSRSSLRAVRFHTAFVWY